MDSGEHKEAKALSKEARYAADPMPRDNKDPLIDLFNTSHGSDCIIKCKDREWKLHTIILSSRSSFFSALFDGKFMESSSKGVNLDDNDPEALEVVLRHLYVRWSRYRSPYILNANFLQTTQFHINVTVTADQLGVLDLAEHVAAGLQRSISKKEWKHSWYADMMTEVMIPAIFNQHICAALEILKPEITSSIADVFSGPEECIDQINLVLCQNPELNKLLLLKHVHW